MSRKTRTEIREQENKLSGLSDVFKALEKEFGPNAGRPIPQHKALGISKLSTGLLTADKVLGGGLPRGRVLEIFGPESSGKTSLCLQMMAAAQAAGEVVAFVDVEHALDPEWAVKLGVNLDTMLFHQPMNGEEAMTIVQRLVQTGQVGVIVVDSVAALVPLAEANGNIGDAHMGRLARLMSQSMRVLVPLVSSNGTILIFTNQIRMNLGVTYGSPEVTPGGNALKFHASVRLNIRRSKLMDDKERMGDTVTMSCIKNKVSIPYIKGEIDLVYAKGFDLYDETITLGVERGVIQQNGAWYSYGDQRIGQGRPQVTAWLMDNETIYNDIRSQIQQGLDKSN